MRNQDCIRRNKRRQKGSALLELAVLTPLLALILAGTMELSRVFYTATAVASAARAGAQYALKSSSTTTDFTGIQNAATSDASGISGITATASQFCECSDGSSTTCGTGGCGGSMTERTYVKVVTSATFNTLGNWGIPNSIAVRNQASVRVK